MSHGISKMTLGTVQLGMPYGIANKTGKPSEVTARAILDAAIDGGVTAFDTANGYGDSEEVLGRYFGSAGAKMRDPFIITKLKVDPADAGSAAAVERQMRALAELSLRRLGVSKLDIYMLHSAGDMTAYGGTVANVMRKLKAEGVIGAAGVSVYTVDEAARMLDDGTYEAIQLPMNIFDLRMAHAGIIGRLAAAGARVFVRSVFLQGLFFLQDDELPEKYRPAIPSLHRLRAISRESGISAAELALAYIRDMAGVTSLVLGSETPEQTAANARLMACPRLPDSIAAQLEEMAAHAPIEDIMAAITGKK